jgi:hypothetical protein
VGIIRIRAGWMKWRQAYDILCVKKVLSKLKVKFYMMVIRLVMMYGVKCWITK